MSSQLLAGSLATSPQPFLLYSRWNVHKNANKMSTQHSNLAYSQSAVSASEDSQQAAAIMRLISTCVADSVSHAQWVWIHAM